MISWKRINLIYGCILCLGSIQITYNILTPIYLKSDLKDFIIAFLVSYAGGVLFHGFVLFLYNMFRNHRLKLSKASLLYTLIGPFLSLPLVVMTLETKIGFTLFFVWFVSLLLQRINWKYVNSIIEDLKLSFYPHLKNGLNEFLDTREQRKHDVKN